ncbi:hypothetical protein CYQ88_00010 [Hydrogenovibrio sp. SC-1]|uniref:CZB domain-containing protein n=1 Tax=Hydrogenovibrio sp. SC-1 TaxID=2065820 RepID=UPI000C7B9568|nr:CZB domain-containing protein [Hydrogenovibrio sp. SC-1]PLA75391.1 hypothetical protein CYQ88_00010 [Hydrogenovibrio sp. SC-1]
MSKLRDLEQVNVAVSALDDMTQQNAALVEQLAATSGNMSEEAKTQADFVGKFKISAITTELGNSKGSQKASFELEEAKNRHRAWTVDLERFLVGEKVEFDENSVRRDDACLLGKWIYSEGKKYEHLAEMQKLITVHAEMHQTVGRVIDAKALGDMQLASQQKDKVGHYSRQIIELIDELKRHLFHDGQAEAKSTASLPTHQHEISEPSQPKGQHDEWEDF